MANIINSNIASFADIALLNELPQLEKQRESMIGLSTYLKEIATANRIQLEEKTGQIEKFNEEITSLTDNIAQLNAKIQYLTEQKNVSHWGLATSTDNHSSSTDLDNFADLMSQIEELTKEESECTRKLKSTKLKKASTNKFINSLIEKNSTTENKISKYTEVLNKISSKILRIQNSKPVHTDSIEEKGSDSSHQNMRLIPSDLTPLQQRLRELTAHGSFKSDNELSKILACNEEQVKVNRQILLIAGSRRKEPSQSLSDIRICIKEIINTENPDKPLTDDEIREELEKRNYHQTRPQIGIHRRALKQGTSVERYNLYKNRQNNNTPESIHQNSNINNSNSNSHAQTPPTASSDSESTQSEQLFSSEPATKKAYVKHFLEHENPDNRYTDEQLSRLLKEKKLSCSATQVARYREALGYPNSRKRYKRDNSNSNNNTNSSSASSMDTSND